MESLRENLGKVAQTVGVVTAHAVRRCGRRYRIHHVGDHSLCADLLLVSKTEVITLIRRLNPLGDEVTDLYLAKMGAMVKGNGQGPVHRALIQGTLGACSICHRGIPAFFIRDLPDRAVGDSAGQWHRHHPVRHRDDVLRQYRRRVVRGAVPIVVITNVDNFLRPILVPRGGPV